MYITKLSMTSTTCSSDVDPIKTTDLQVPKINVDSWRSLANLDLPARRSVKNLTKCMFLKSRACSRDAHKIWHCCTRGEYPTGMRTGIFQKRGNPVQKEETPSKMYQISACWVKPDTIYFSKFQSKKRKSSKKRKILIPDPSMCTKTRIWLALSQWVKTSWFHITQFCVRIVGYCIHS